MAERYRFGEKGGLRPPGPFGRVVRLVLGAFCIWAVWAITTQGAGVIKTGDLSDGTWWLLMGIALFAFPDVVNIGFTLKWKANPMRAGVVGAAGLMALVGWATTGHAFAPPLGAFVFFWLLYTLGHLGISFVLASLIGTPGCEMRSLPQLLGMLTGRSTSEHYCPGILSPIDRLEFRVLDRIRGGAG
jgi:hypothetical protein